MNCWPLFALQGLWDNWEKCKGVQIVVSHRTVASCFQALMAIKKKVDFKVGKGRPKGSTNCGRAGYADPHTIKNELLGVCFNVLPVGSRGPRVLMGASDGARLRDGSHGGGRPPGALIMSLGPACVQHGPRTVWRRMEWPRRKGGSRGQQRWWRGAKDPFLWLLHVILLLLLFGGSLRC